MIVTALIPLFPLRIAVIEARVAWDDPIALGPAPGDAQVIGACTTAAWDQGVRPGLRVGEALARCPGLDLVTPHPDAVRMAVDRVTERLEGLGAAVQPHGDGMWSFMADGLMRLHDGLPALMRRVRAALPKLRGVPSNVRIDISFDQSAYIRSAVKSLEHEALQGGLLAKHHHMGIGSQTGEIHRLGDLPRQAPAGDMTHHRIARCPGLQHGLADLFHFPFVEKQINALHGVPSGLGKNRAKTGDAWSGIQNGSLNTQPAGMQR
jgi:hypothetical protein